MSAPIPSGDSALLTAEQLLEAERWVVGACALEPGMISGVREILGEARLSSWMTQEPWEAILAAYDAGSEDPAVDAEIKLRAVGKATILDDCVNGCASTLPSIVHARAHSVVDAAEGRRVAGILADAAHAAHHAGPDKARVVLDRINAPALRAERRAKAARDANTLREKAEALADWANDDQQTCRVQEMNAVALGAWYDEHVQILASVESESMREDLIGIVNGALGKRKKPVGRWRADIQTFRSAQARAAAADLDNRIVEDLFPHAGINGGAAIPVGFEASEEGLARTIWRKDGTPSAKPVAPVPLFIRRRLVDLDTGTHQVELVWPARPDRAWPSLICGRDVIAAARKLPELAASGLPVNSVSAAGLVEFLAAYEVANQAAIPEASVSGRLGWHDKPHGFLYGHTFLRPAGASARSTIEMNAQGALEQVADALVPEGDPALEQQALMAAVEHPKVAAAIAGALAAALLHIIHCPPFTVSLEGTTSKGKSSAAQLAMAPWGRVREQDDATLFRTWAATRVALEALLTSTRGVPLFFDDTARIDPKLRSMIASIIYDVTGGQARARGNVQGDGRAVRSGATVLLSTGETRMLDETMAGGARARVIPLTSPLWRDDPDIGETIKSLVSTVEDNHGHTARAFMVYLLARPEAWEEFRADHVKLTAQIAGRIAAVAKRHAVHAAGVIDRLAKSIAAMTLALQLAMAAKILPLTSDHIKAMTDAVVLECRANVVESDPFLAAFELVAQRALAQPGALWTSGAKDPPGGWIGVRRSDRLVLMPEVVERWLEERGHRYAATLREWGNREWIVKDRTNLCPKVEVAGARTRKVCLRRQSLQEELGVDWDLLQTEKQSETEEALRNWSERSAEGADDG